MQYVLELKLKIKGIYQHYKGNVYQVVDVVRDSETVEEMVLYKPLYKSEQFKNQMWVRPLKMFMETIEIEGKDIPRFKLIKNPSKK